MPQRTTSSRTWPLAGAGSGRSITASSARSQLTALTALKLPSFGLAQLDPADLARERLRQRLDELDPARVCVRAQPTADEALDVVGQLVRRVRGLGQHDEGLDHVAALIVGRGDGG